MNPGEVIRITMWSGELVVPPVIALVLNTREDVEFLTGGSDNYNEGQSWIDYWRDGNNGIPWSLDYDTDKIKEVPPEEWTDEICRAVALFNLTGDAS